MVIKRKNKRFVLIGPVYPYRGGIAHYTTMLHHTLCEHGHQVLTISFKRQYPRWLYPGRSDKDPSRSPLVVKNTHYWLDSLNPISWLTTFWHIYQYRPDAIILQWWTTFWALTWLVLGILNKLFLRKPIIIICHNVLPHEARKWDVFLTKLALRWGNQFIVQSSSEKDILTSLLRRNVIDIIPHPIYDMFSEQRVSKETARKKLRLPQNIPILLFFGFVREYKRLKATLMALPYVRDQWGEIKLLIAGEFWENKRPYIELIEKLSIQDMIIVDDRYIPNEEVGIYFSAADALIAPYHYTKGSGATNMAIGFGLPIVPSENRITNTDDSTGIAHEIIRFLRKETHKTQMQQHHRGSHWSDLVSALEKEST